ncbi:hypothetical protein V6Z11_D05G232200 [Gossypium hirsutum]
MNLRFMFSNLTIRLTISFLYFQLYDQSNLFNSHISIIHPLTNLDLGGYTDSNQTHQYGTLCLKRYSVPDQRIRSSIQHIKCLKRHT